MLKWCKDCVWASNASGKTYCPWAAGMCIRIKGSFENPDAFKLRKKILRTEYGMDQTENKESKKK